MRLPATEAVIVGGGVIGAAAAWWLAGAGVGVTVVERGGLGQEASGANVGLVTLFSGHSLDEPEPGPLYELTRRSADLYRALGEAVGVDIEYECPGGILLADTPDALGRIRRASEGYRRHGVPVEWLDPDAVRACEPALHHEGILGGALCPLNGHLNPLRLTRALALGAERRGARFLVGTEVRDLRHEGGQVRAVVTAVGEIPCEIVVIAAGAWAAAVGALAGLAVPVQPARGQVMVTEARPPLLHRVLAGIEPSARQTRRGNVVIGSTVERAGFDRGVTSETMAHFARGVLRRYPSLRGLRVIRAWAGLRPMTPDGKPIIDLVPEPRGLCLAVGHGRRGVCYAGGTGQLVMELVTGRSPSLAAEAFSAARFPPAARPAGDR